MAGVEPGCALTFTEEGGGTDKGGLCPNGIVQLFADADADDSLVGLGPCVVYSGVAEDG